MVFSVYVRSFCGWIERWRILLDLYSVLFEGRILFVDVGGIFYWIGFLYVIKEKIYKNKFGFKRVFIDLYRILWSK